MDRVFTMPGHTLSTRVACGLVNTVVNREWLEVRDQETTTWNESVRLLYVESVLDGSTYNLLAFQGENLEGAKDRVQLIYSEVFASEHCNMTLLTDLRYRDDGLWTHTRNHDRVELHGSKFSP